MSTAKMRSNKKRKPKLTRLEKMTKGLMLPSEEIKSKFCVREVGEKGRALFLTSKIIRKDSFVLEYEGDVISHDEAEFRERIYESNDEGCYILFFRFQERKLAIDATRRFDSYARYLNHSRKPNIRFHPPLLVELTGKGVPRIASYALRDIHQGEEIVFDYGIKDGQISWLRNRKRCHASELTDSSNEYDSSSSDDDQESKRDQIMSVTRTPKQNLSLKPSKYLAPIRVLSSNSKPASLTIPRDGYGIRYIAYPSGSGIKKCYVASMEGLGQPLKIMRSVEESTSKREVGSKSSQSVISLSESDDLSVKSPTHVTASECPTNHIDSSLPFNAMPSSASKVLEWQQKIELSPTKQCSDSHASNLKILHVITLQEKKPAVPLSSSSLNSSNDNSSQVEDSVSKLPCISNVMNGSSVPTGFIPNMMRPDYLNCNNGRDTMLPRSIPLVASNSSLRSRREYNPIIQRPNHPIPQSQTPLRFDRGANDVINGAVNKSPSSFSRKLSCSANVLRKQPVEGEMICLSDSEEDVIVQIPGGDNDVKDYLQTPAVSLNKKASYQNDLSGEGEEIVISNVESLNSGLDNANQRKEVHTVYKNGRGEVYTVYKKGRSEDQTAYQNDRSEVYTVYQNDRSGVHTVYQNDRSGAHTMFQNLKTEIESENQDHNKKVMTSGKVQYMYQDQSGGIVHREYQTPHKDNSQDERSNAHSAYLSVSVPNRPLTKKRALDKEPETKRKDIADLVEIFDDEESDFEIISDGELPSTSIPVSSALIKPSCSKISTVPSGRDTHQHRSKPHIAIVKPYSKENDQVIILEESVVGENDGIESHLGKTAECDVIEVIEGTSSDDDDGIILTDGKSSKVGESELTQDEISTMKTIFQPLILASDSLSNSCVEKAIGENLNFFSVLIGRGVPVNKIRRTVWELFKNSRKQIVPF